MMSLSRIGKLRAAKKPDGSRKLTRKIVGIASRSSANFETSTPIFSSVDALLDPVDEDLAGFGAAVEQAARLAHRVAERHVLLQELELAAGAGGAEGHERALILIDIERVAWLDEHVLVRILHQIDEIDRPLRAVTLQSDEFLVAGIANAAGARNCVEHPIARRIDRNLAGIVDLAQHGDLRRRLADDGYDRLRFDRAVLQLVDDVLLNGGRSAVQHPDLPGVRNRDEALAVDCLIGQRDKIAWAAAGVVGNEQPARLRFEQGDLKGVADADLDLGHRTVTGAEGSQQRARTRIGDQRQDDAVQIDERVIENRTCGRSRAWRSLQTRRSAATGRCRGSSNIP